MHDDWMLDRFEENRPRLRGVAYRMLGSLSEADDAVQEAWLRVDRTDTEEVDTLAPAERLAFVLHDMFALPFDEIAPIVGRSPAAARQLASRARRRVQGGRLPEPDLSRQRQVVDAYLAATRAGDFDALITLLDPDVVLRADAKAVPTETSPVVRGAQVVARSAAAASARAKYTTPALVDGSVGLVMAPRGRLFLVLAFTFSGDKISAIDVIAEPERLRELELAVLDS